MPDSLASADAPLPDDEGPAAEESLSLSLAVALDAAAAASSPGLDEGEEPVSLSLLPLPLVAVSLAVASASDAGEPLGLEEKDCSKGLGSRACLDECATGRAGGRASGGGERGRR